MLAAFYELLIAWRYLHRYRKWQSALVPSLVGLHALYAGLGAALFLVPRAQLPVALGLTVVTWGMVAFFAREYVLRQRAGEAHAVLWLVPVCTSLLCAVPATLVYFSPQMAGPVGVAVFASGVGGLIFFCLLWLFTVFTTISVWGVVVGVASLSVVLSVTSGFQREFRDKVLGVNAHVLVMKYGLDFREYRHVAQVARRLPEVRGASPFVLNEMLVARAGEHPGVLVKGIDPTLVGKILDLPRHMVAGSVADLAAASTASASPKPPGILLGRELARKLKAGVGDQVRVIAPLASLDSSDWSAGTRTPRFRDFRVAGIFYSGFDEYDRRLVYIELSQAQSFFEQGDVVTGVEIALHDADRSAEVVAELSKRLGGSPYRIFDWRELNHNLFTALKLQKLVLGIALTLIVIVAAFNIVSALTMMVIGKTKEIAILKSMGARGTAGIFLCAGLIIGTVGTVLGVGLGALLCLVIQHYGYPLDPRVYLIDKLPVQVRAAELALTALITLAICVASTLYPSLRAARLRPSEGLRYE